MRVGKPGESVVAFVMQLRQNTKHCEFGNSLEEILGDCLVCGIVDGKMQCALLIRHVGTGPVGPALAGPLFGNIKIEAQFSINE